ncbi:hypothetical protein FRC03_011697 [Tulasnella sp. 419]|nr:hypothetical protein FRC03_011697 [Tulasnella sp. 419]
MLWFLVVYILGGLTMLPLAVIAFLAAVVYLSPPVGDVDPAKPTKKVLQANVAPNTVTQQGWIVLRRTFAASELNAASYINNLVRSLRQSTPQRPPDTFYAQLKRTVLYLYDDEHCSDCHAAIQLSAFNVDIYPGGQLDGELFAKRNAIRLTRVPSSKQDTLDGRSESPLDEEPYFVFIKNTSHMEDWYLSLIHASSNPHSDPLHPLQPVFSTQHMAHLVDTLDSQPDPIPMRWLNALVGRLFFSMYRTKFLESLLIARLMKKISKVPRPAFLKEIVVREVNVGTTVPFFSKPMLKELTAQGDAAVELGLSYYSDNPRDRINTQTTSQSSTTMDSTSSADSTIPNQNILTSTGGVRIIVEATVSIDIKSSLPLNLGARFDVKPIIVKVVLAVVLRSLEGNLVVRLKRPPSNRIWYGFTSMPKMELELLPIVSDRKIKWGLILKPLENLLKEVIQESVVLPYMDDIPFFDTEDHQHRGGIFADSVRTSYDFSASRVPTTANINTGTDGNTEIQVPGQPPVVLGPKDKEDSNQPEEKKGENEESTDGQSAASARDDPSLKRTKSAEQLNDGASVSTVSPALDSTDTRADPLQERTTTLESTTSLPVPIPGDAKVPAVLVNSPPRKTGWLARFGNPSNTSVASSLKDGSASIVNWEDKGVKGDRERTLSSGSKSVKEERAPSPARSTHSERNSKAESPVVEQPSKDDDSKSQAPISTPIEPQPSEPSTDAKPIVPDIPEAGAEAANEIFTPVPPISTDLSERSATPSSVQKSPVSDVPSVPMSNTSIALVKERPHSPTSSARSPSPPPTAVQAGQALLAAWKNRDRQGAQVVLESTMRKWGFGPGAKKSSTSSTPESSNQRDNSAERKGGVNEDDPAARTKSFAEMRANVAERRKTSRPSSPANGSPSGDEGSPSSTQRPNSSSGENATDSLGPFSFFKSKPAPEASNDRGESPAPKEPTTGRPRSDTAHSRSMSVTPTLLVSSPPMSNGHPSHSRGMSMGGSNQGELGAPHPIFSRQPGQGATMKIPGIHASHRNDVMSLGSSPPRPSAPLSSPPTPSRSPEVGPVMGNEKVQVALQSVIRLFNKSGNATGSDGGSGSGQRAATPTLRPDQDHANNDRPTTSSESNQQPRESTLSSADASNSDDKQGDRITPANESSSSDPPSKPIDGASFTPSLISSEVSPDAIKLVSEHSLIDETRDGTS